MRPDGVRRLIPNSLAAMRLSPLRCEDLSVWTRSITDWINRRQTTRAAPEADAARSARKEKEGRLPIAIAFCLRPGVHDLEVGVVEQINVSIAIEVVAFAPG